MSAASSPEYPDYLSSVTTALNSVPSTVMERLRSLLITKGVSVQALMDQYISNGDISGVEELLAIKREDRPDLFDVKSAGQTIEAVTNKYLELHPEMIEVMQPLGGDLRSRAAERPQ